MMKWIIIVVLLVISFPRLLRLPGRGKPRSTLTPESMPSR
ncbi:type I toxin-antitoxin system Ibs family toxin [Escherichia coli]|nr:type I toxin-antitoxin system Ibs family toxin [Escherichia coli]